MRTLRILSLACLALGLTSSFACKPKPPEGTTPPEDATASADGGGDKKEKKGKKGKKGDGGKGAQEEEDPTKKVCPAEVGDVSTPVFAESALVKLPKGVAAMVEQNPMFATMNPSEVESVSCVEGVPGAMISFGAMGYFEDDKKKDIKLTADETIKTIYGDLAVTKSEETTGGGGDRRSYTVVLDVPADPKAQKDVAKSLVTLKSAYGRMYWMIWETHPNAWNALKSTFKMSSDELLFLDPGA